MLKIYTEEIKFHIRILTYPRNGTNKIFLSKTLASIYDQIYKNWHIYLVGDNYDPIEELYEISSFLPKDKITIRNARVESERFKYTGTDLWHCGGVNAGNFSFDLMISEGAVFICIMTDCDIWKPNHLSCLAFAYQNYPDVGLVYTKGSEKSLGIIPRENVTDIKYGNNPKMYKNTLYSSVSWRLDKTNLRFNNCVEQNEPSDADLWERMEKSKSHGFKIIYIPKETILHLSHKPIVSKK